MFERPQPVINDLVSELSVKLPFLSEDDLLKIEIVLHKAFAAGVEFGAHAKDIMEQMQKVYARIT